MSDPGDETPDWPERLERMERDMSGLGAPDEYQTLIERRDWLAARIKAKFSVGWDTSYDEREHKALAWATAILMGQQVVQWRALNENDG